MAASREEVEVTALLLQDQAPLLEPQPLWRSWARRAVEKPTERSKGEKIQHGGDGGEGMPTSRLGQIQVCVSRVPDLPSQP